MSQRCLPFVRSVWESFRANSGLEPRLLDGVRVAQDSSSNWERHALPIITDLVKTNRDGQLRITSARPGTVNFELDIKKEHTNRLSILHGGTIASMVDLGGSLAVASRGLFATGVSTDLNVTYLNSGGKVGDTIRAEVVCDKFGKTLAYTSIKFTNASDELVARGSHTKYVSFAWKDPNNIVEELSPKGEGK